MQNAMRQPTCDFTGRRVLVVEDEYFIATDLVQALEDRGAQVLGPAASVADALKLMENAGPIDGAVIDINLHGEWAFPIAQALTNRHVRFVFATGYDAQVIPQPFQNILRCEKPIDVTQVASGLFD
jgi:ActR/RegA family two-component response regulator